MIDEARHARLRADASQIEHMLAELRELVVPAAWLRIERVLGRIVALYGAGLESALEHARSAGASPAELVDLVTSDDLLASLLVLHGLHPLPADERVRRALAGVRDELALPAEALALVDIVDRTVRVTVDKATSTPRLTARIIRRAVEAAAPELEAVVVDGLEEPAGERLVQLRTRKPA